MYRANEVRRKKAMDNRWELYEFVCKHPNLSIYQLTKELKWTAGKVEYYAKKLVKEGLLINETKVVNGRTNKIYAPKKWKEFMNGEEIIPQ